MWILPKQLHTSAFALDTAALISDLAEQSQICEQSLLARSKPSLARTWSQKWKRDTWTQHLSGRILKPSHGKTFVTAWTSSLGVILASHSQPQGSDSDETTLDTSGRGLQMELGLCDPESASSRMSRDTSALDSEKSSANWKALVIKRRGEYSLRVKSAHLTNGSECLSWPSVVASEVRQGFQDRSRGKKGSQESLTTAVIKHGQAAQVNHSTNGSRQESWGTPSCMDTLPARSPEALARAKMKGGCKNLREEVHQWATPNTMDYMEPRPVDAMKQMLDHGQRKNRKWSSNVREQVVWDQKYAPSWATPQTRDHRSGDQERFQNPDRSKKLNDQMPVQNAKLNPRWVETLMGLPIGWTMPSCLSPVTIAPTNSGCLETEWSQSPQPELFVF